MSEHAAMKRRVRGLLHHKWLQPLLALVLAVLPILVVSIPVILLTRPAAFENPFQMELTGSAGDLQTIALMLFPMLSKPAQLINPLLGWLPMVGALAAICIFIAMPLSVSVAGYFLNFLRGKNPKPTDVYGCFSGRYPQILAGMAYRFLWLLLWFIGVILLPLALMLCSVVIASLFDVGFKQIYIFGGILIGGLVWLIVGICVFINRLLAYSLTASCIAAQPRLPSQRATRLSRKLMLGSKWRLLGMLLSFLIYFLPAIIAAIALPLLAHFGPVLGFAEGLINTLRIVLFAIIGVNQLAWAYVAPYIAASFHAFYIERKREALMDQELTQDDFAGTPAQKTNTEEKTQE